MAPSDLPASSHQLKTGTEQNGWTSPEEEETATYLGSGTLTVFPHFWTQMETSALQGLEPSRFILRFRHQLSRVSRVAAADSGTRQLPHRVSQFLILHSIIILFYIALCLK